MKLSPEGILKVKTKNTVNIVEGSPLYKAVISAMRYYAKQEVGAVQQETIVKYPKHNSTDMINFLLVNALRSLDKEKLHILTKNLVERDALDNFEQRLQTVQQN